MNRLQAASDILRQAEQGLRALIDSALVEPKYDDVSELARLADGVARLNRGFESPESSGPDEVRTGNATTTVNTPKQNSDSASDASIDGESVKSVRARKVDEYPRFERESDRLVKIGWSKKDRRAYEHRAPKPVIGAVSKALASKRPGRVFTMEQLLPFKAADGAEIPSYQAYLVLAWLRSMRLVQKRGKEGYVVKSGVLEEQNLERLWESTPSRE